MEAATTHDRIEKKVLLPAPRTRVWRALTNVKEFEKWFAGVKLSAPFAAGQTVHGTLTMKGYEGRTFEMAVERVDPERLFSFRWHPGAIDRDVNYSLEAMTLIQFVLRERADGTVVTLTESGFDQIPLARRAKAFRDNDEGWTEQLANLERYIFQVG